MNPMNRPGWWDGMERRQGRMIGLLVAFMAMSWLCGRPAAAAEIQLVRDGKPQSIIVVPADSNAISEFAAQELRHHIQLITGAELPILNETNPEVKRHAVRMYIGRTQRTLSEVADPKALPPSGYILRTVGTDLFFAGNDEVVRYKGSSGQPVTPSLDGNVSRIGSMLAVYDYLEHELGVRWLWPGDLGTDFTRQASLPLPRLDRQGGPQYLFKLWRVPRFMTGKAGWSSGQARDRFLLAQSTWLRRHHYQQVIEATNGGTHSFKMYWRQYGKTHPEYFARLPNGKHEPLPGDKTGARISMSVAEPSLWKRIVANWEQRKQTPLNEWLSVGENDTPGLCTCDLCRAWDAPDPGFADTDYWGKGIIPPNGQRFRWDWSKTPSLADRYARFYLAVYNEAVKTHPNIVVSGFAYANYAKAPKQTRLNRNIFISLVPSSDIGLSSSSYFPYTQAKSEAFRAQWDGWLATGARVSLRPNFTLSGHNFPIFYADTFGKDVLYAVQHGMSGSDFDSLRGSFATQGPTLYVVARVQERPDLGVEGALDEYYAAFGKAEPAVRAYFNHWRDLSDRMTQQRMRDAMQKGGASREYSQWFLTAPGLFSERDMARGRELMNAALAVKTDDPVVARRVEYLDLGLQDVERLMALTRSYHAYQRSPNEKTLKTYVDAMAGLQAFRAKTEGWHLFNQGMLSREEQQVFDWKLIQTENEPPTGRLPLIWKFQWDPNDVGQAQQWYKPTLDTADWLNITYGAWQQQPAGMAWRQAHGAQYEGYAWYRTPLIVPTFDPENSRVVLRFGAVDETARVWIDGRQVLDRVYDQKKNPDAWKESFDVDITDAVISGNSHQLTVRVQSLSGLGGMTRPVRLLVEQR